MSNEITYHNENFPIGMMVASKLKPLVNMYYRAARFADDIADSNVLEKEQKISKNMQLLPFFPKSSHNFC